MSLLRAECSPTGLREATDGARVRCVKQLGGRSHGSPLEGPARHRRRRLHGVPRRDHREHRLPRPAGRLRVVLAGRAVVGAQRLQHRLRRAARPGRAACRPHRPAADVLRRPGALPGRLGAACGLAPSVPVLVAARVVQAVGAAALIPTSLALLLPEFPLEQRATATALWGATGAVAAATGPSLGGLLVDATGWRSVFFVNLVFGAIALVPARRLLRETRDPAPGPLPDAAGVALLVGGVGLLSLGIVRRPTGAGGRRPCSAPSAGRCCSSSRCGSGPAASPRPSSTRRSSPCAPSRWRTSASCSSASASTRCSWATCCS